MPVFIGQVEVTTLCQRPLRLSRAKCWFNQHNHPIAGPLAKPRATLIQALYTATTAAIFTPLGESDATSGFLVVLADADMKHRCQLRELVA